MIWMAGGSGFLLGTVWGSFINLCIDRWKIRYGENPDSILTNPRFSKKLKDHLRQETFSPLIPSRSFCFFCGHRLSVTELIPIFSYLFSRGRCRRCDVAYGIRSVFVELTHGFCFGALFVWLERWPAIVILALDFSLIWLLGSCHHFPKQGRRLKGWAFILICLNPILFLMLKH